MKKIVVLSAALAVAACAGPDGEAPRMSPGGVLGAAVGAAAGGLLGAQFGGGLGNVLFIATGATVGAGAGYVVGEMMLPSDWAMYNRTADEALSNEGDGGMRRWANPETGASGIIRPTRSYRSQSGLLCRDYRATVAVKDLVQSGDGSACRMQNGQWYAMNDELS